MANSAATKNAFAATRSSTRMILSRTRVTMASNHILAGALGRVAERPMPGRSFAFFFPDLRSKAIVSYELSVSFRELLSSGRRIHKRHTQKKAYPYGKRQKKE